MTASGDPRTQVAADERAWTSQELADVRASLEAEVARLERQQTVAAQDFGLHVGDYINDLGDEVIDIGALMVEMSEGTSLASNESEILRQTRRALHRIDSAQYGVCEGCSGPIGKARMMALPRATHCLGCRQKPSR